MKLRCSIMGLCLLLGGGAALAQDSVTTLAGQVQGRGLTNGPAAQAWFNDPAALVADAGGNLFITDSQNHVIREISTNGIVSTFAGQAGVPGSSNGMGSKAQFDTPSGIALAPDGNFYVSDTGNHTIRKITAVGEVSTFAGSPGQSGFTNGVGTAARFNAPLGLTVAPDGTLFVADSGNHLIRAISPAAEVTTLAGSPGDWGTTDGTGAAARFNGPVGVACDPAGNLFVSDANNHTIRKITPTGAVSTWAGVTLQDGHVDGDRHNARFAKPAELAFDVHGNLFVADSFNQVIRKITPDGTVSTVTGQAGTAGANNGSNGVARWFNPYGLTLRPDGSLVVADAYNELIRTVMVPFQVQLNTTPGNALATLSWDSITGRQYQVQCQTALGQPWNNLGGPVTATGQTTQVTEPGSDGAGQTIYRIMVLP